MADPNFLPCTGRPLLGVWNVGGWVGTLTLGTSPMVINFNCFSPWLQDPCRQCNWQRDCLKQQKPWNDCFKKYQCEIWFKHPETNICKLWKRMEICLLCVLSLLPRNVPALIPTFTFCFSAPTSCTCRSLSDLPEEQNFTTTGLFELHNSKWHF